MATRRGIAVAGTVLVDKICEISAYPKAGELTKINSVGFAVGGCVPNVAIDMKRIMPELEIRAIGLIGADTEGALVKSTLESEGVCTEELCECATVGTGFTDVMSITGGQRTFFTHAGANAHFGKNDVKLDTLPSKMLHLGYFLLLDKIDRGEGEALLRSALEAGISTSIDLVSENSDRYRCVLPCLPYTDNLIINELEAEGITSLSAERDGLRALAERLIELGVRKRVIIHTPTSSVCLTRESFVELPSYKLPDGFIKGTTGAGDAFCAGALIGIHEGLSDEELLTLASRAAVSSLTEKDATSGVRSIEILKELTEGLQRYSK